MKRETKSFYTLSTFIVLTLCNVSDIAGEAIPPKVRSGVSYSCNFHKQDLGQRHAGLWIITQSAALMRVSPQSDRD
jgi:hypothetical protein